MMECLHFILVSKMVMLGHICELAVQNSFLMFNILLFNNTLMNKVYPHVLFYLSLQTTIKNRLLLSSLFNNK
jgi:hypothetical protein